MVASSRLSFTMAALVASAGFITGCGEEEKPGQVGKIVVHDDTEPNRMRLEVNDEDLTADSSVQTVTVKLASQTDTQGIEVTLQRKEEGGYTSFQASGIRLTDPANEWWTASNSQAQVLLATNGETITATYQDADPAAAITGTKTWTAKPELKVEKSGSESSVPRSTAPDVGVTIPENERVIAHDFGTHAVGSYETIEIHIKNIGEAPMEIIGTPINRDEDPAPTNFVFQPAVEFPATVAPKSSLGRTLYFQPQSAEKHWGGVMIWGATDGWFFWVVGTGE